MSSSRGKIAGRVPQRERGKRRVASLLEAALSLFAEKGYDAVTMTEVAARAGAPIGSLYQFFPSKEVLADALLDRFGERLEETLEGIEGRAATVPTPELADALLRLFVGSREERAAISALIESRQEASARAAELTLSLGRRVARILRAGIPGLSPGRVETMAQVAIQLMKAAARVDVEKEPAVRDAVLVELTHVLALYLIDRRADPGGDAPPARGA